MQPQHIDTLARDMPVLDLEAGPTYEEAMASARELGVLGELQLGLARFRGQPPWERHPADELIHVIAGSVDMTLRQAGGDEVVPLVQGDLVVIPAGVWHRSHAPDGVTVLCGTSGEGNDRSLDPS